MVSEVVLRRPTPEEISQAKLPAQYEAMKHAITECTSIDECKEWADKAAALAGYFRMAGDETAFHKLRALQQWALRKAGEILKQIPSDKGGDRRSDQSTGAHTLIHTRTQAAKDVGMSKHQATQAKRLASIPEKDFARVAGSITTTELAMRGTVSRPTAPAPTPGDARLAVEVIKRLQELAAFCSVHDPASIAYSVADFDTLSGYAQTVTRWLKRCVACLSREEVA
jgi:hypothetical protein